MARAFTRKGDAFVARLDDVEREVVLGLLEQAHGFLVPTHRELTGDPFDDLVARLGLPRIKDMQDPAHQSQQVPRDPALERLLPSGHHDDEKMAAEFRHLTEHGLRARKAANLATAISALRAREGDKPGGDKVRLNQEQAQAMVVALTDVRLVLGDRLGLRTDDDADALQDLLEAAPEDDPKLHLAAYYDFLTWLQESLIQALMR